MAATGKKEYNVVINGISQDIKEVTSLYDALQKLNAEFEKTGKVSVHIGNTTKARTEASKEASKALTDEEKAAKKLAETETKILQVKDGLTKAQVAANAELKEANRLVALQVREEQAASNSVEQMRAELAKLTQEWKNTDMGSDRFKELTAQISETSGKLKDAEGSIGDFRRNVGDYENAIKSAIIPTQGLTGQLAAMAQAPGGIIAGLNGMTKAALTFIATPLGATLTAIVAVVSAFSKGISTSEENTAKFNKILAPLQVALDAVLNVLQKVVGWVLDYALFLMKAADATAGFIAGLVGMGDEYDKLADKAREGMELEQRRINLAKETRKLNEEEKKQQVEIADLRNKVAQKDKYTHEQRLSFLDEAIKKETEIAEKRKAIAEENLAVMEEEAARAQNTAEVEEKLSAARMAVSEATLNLMSRTRELNAQRVEALNAMKAETKEVTKAQTDAIRAAEDARLKLIVNTDEQARKILEASYNRQIEDLKYRLKTEENLTVTTRKAINDTIISLEEQKTVELDKLQKAQAEKSLSITREVEDSRISLIDNEYDKQYATINAQYDRQIEAYKKRLAEDKTLTENQQKEMSELIFNAQTARGDALIKLQAEQLQKETDQQLAAVENALKITQNRVGEMFVRDNDGLQLINVDATRKNLSETNKALDEYINGLQNYLSDLDFTHTQILANLKEGTPEYEAELQKYSVAVSDATKKIKDSQNEQVANTKDSKNLMLQYYQELFDKISQYARMFSDSLSMGVETASMALQAQLDALNESLEDINEKYDKAQEQSDKAAEHVENIEQQMQSASGGTAEALKVQLQDAMHARNEAAREEERLAREKERTEAEIAKKEKQMKRAELIQNIGVATANVAQGITAALSMGLPGIIMAAVISALGVAQVGIMTKQLVKLEDGGEIKGPSHAKGGVPIAGTNIEVEGGEFVINKTSYAANEGLVKLINDTPRAITAADISGILPGTVVVSGQANNDTGIIEAIQNIIIRPTVAVTDIQNASDTVVEVRDIAGFGEEN